MLGGYLLGYGYILRLWGVIVRCRGICRGMWGYVRVVLDFVYVCIYKISVFLETYISYSRNMVYL